MLNSIIVISRSSPQGLDDLFPSKQELNGGFWKIKIKKSMEGKAIKRKKS